MTAMPLIKIEQYTLHQCIKLGKIHHENREHLAEPVVIITMIMIVWLQKNKNYNLKKYIRP